MGSPTIRLQREDFDAAIEAAKLTRGRTDIGAVVTFSGICRDHEAGHGVQALTLEHYPGMAEEEIARHVEEAKKRWPLLGVTVIHRYGRLLPGDNIVLVVTASTHRQAAFAAAGEPCDQVANRGEAGRHVDDLFGLADALAHPGEIQKLHAHSSIRCRTPARK